MHLEAISGEELRNRAVFKAVLIGDSFSRKALTEAVSHCFWVWLQIMRERVEEMHSLLLLFNALDLCFQVWLLLTTAYVLLCSGVGK